MAKVSNEVALAAQYVTNDALIVCTRTKLAAILQSDDKRDYTVWFGATTINRLRVSHTTGEWRYELHSYALCKVAKNSSTSNTSSTLSTTNADEYYVVAPCMASGVLLSAHAIEDIILSGLGEKQVLYVDWSTLFDMVMYGRPDMTLVSHQGSIRSAVSSLIHIWIQESSRSGTMNLDELARLLQNSSPRPFRSTMTAATCILTAFATSGRMPTLLHITKDNAMELLRQAIVRERNYITEVLERPCTSECALQTLLDAPLSMEEIRWAIGHAQGIGNQFSLTFATPGVGTVECEWSSNGMGRTTTWYNRLIKESPTSFYQTLMGKTEASQCIELLLSTRGATGHVSIDKMAQHDVPCSRDMLSHYYVPGKTIVCPLIHAIVLAGRVNTHNVVSTIDQLVTAAMEPTMTLRDVAYSTTKDLDIFVLALSVVRVGAKGGIVTLNDMSSLKETIHRGLTTVVDNPALAIAIKHVLGEV